MRGTFVTFLGRLETLPLQAMYSPSRSGCSAFAVFLLGVLVSCGGGSSNSGGGGGGGVSIPGTPSGLIATVGNQQVALSWNAVSGATGYHVKRSTTSGSGYAQIASPADTSYTDTGLTNGTIYYYVVSAVNSAGESGNSGEASAKPAAPVVAVQINVDVLANRHAISPLVYGVNFPNHTAYVTDSGATLVRWGGNASTRYNWKTFDTNAANDWYFINRTFLMQGDDPALYQDSTQFVANIAAAGSSPLMTIGMLPWVAKDNTSYSYSVARYGAQCKTEPGNSDVGNGQLTDCKTNLTGNDPHDAHVPLLDGPPQSGDPAGSVYRNQWVAALAPAFGTSPHFYDMDNEIDIWGGTHHDVHPNPSGYNELRDVFLRESRALKSWDPQAVRFGPVSCCWWFYWNGANSNDKGTHAGIDFLPWWLNEVYWSDQIVGSRSLDVFDFHAYPDAPDFSTWTTAQKQALALRVMRDWWDPNYTSESWLGTNQYVTRTQPVPGNPFRIPRIRAMVNSIYPGTPISITEWNAAFAGESDFSTALVDADAFGILGRERVWAASRWTAADPTYAAYQALKLYRNYDGQHSGFGSTSVAATNTGDPDLLSTYAGLDTTGTKLTLLVINKDPNNTDQAQIAVNGFTPSQVTSYTLSQANQTQIVASSTQAWSATQTFAPYSATLLVISGSMVKAPGADWQLVPDTTMVPAGGSVALAATITPGSGTVTLNSVQSDPGISGSITQASVTTAQSGTIAFTAGTTPGFYHYTVSGTDNTGVAQTQGGWILVGNPAAALTKTGDNQTGTPGSTLNLTVTLVPGQSGGVGAGATILFTTDAGSLSARRVQTDGSGNASVVLSLPASSGPVHVTAEGPFGLGHPLVTFTETAQ